MLAIIEEEEPLSIFKTRFDELAKKLVYSDSGVKYSNLQLEATNLGIKAANCKTINISGHTFMYVPVDILSSLESQKLVNYDFIPCEEMDDLAADYLSDDEYDEKYDKYDKIYN